MIRITSGSAKNKRLVAPVIEGFRAVQEVAKLSVFSILGEMVENAKVLDLFAGSGSMGLEALSRGATWCDFVDENYESAEAITANINNCQFQEKSEVFRSNAAKYTTSTDRKYDVIFLDPFYEDVSHVFLMKNLEEILNKNGKVIFFHGDKLKIEEVTKDTKFVVETQRRFGKSFFTILTR